MEKIDVVIMAGGGGIREDDPVKALLPIGSRVMLDYVLQALGESQHIGRLVLVGSPELRSHYLGQERLLFAKGGSTPLESFAAGVNVLDSTNAWVMACTADIPFLTPQAVDDFIGQCVEKLADFYYPVIKKETVEREFPGVERTYVKLRDGIFTGGNLLLVKREILKDTLSQAEGFVRMRKKPIALARQVGFGILLRYFFGLLTISLAEERVSKLVGVRGRAVISEYPEIGVDVDKVSDLELLERLPLE